MRGCTNLNLQSLQLSGRTDAQFALYAGRSTTENKQRHRQLNKKRCRPLYGPHFRDNAASEGTIREGLQILWQGSAFS